MTPEYLQPLVELTALSAVVIAPFIAYRVGRSHGANDFY